MGNTAVIAQTIQLALAPVFVLVAIGNIMNILSTRLGRVVDRSRVLQTLHATTSGVEHDAVVREIRTGAWWGGRGCCGRGGRRPRAWSTSRWCAGSARSAAASR